MNRSISQSSACRLDSILELPFFARIKQEHTTTHYCPQAGPDGDVDRLLFSNRHLERAQLDVVSLLGVAKLAVQQSHDAGHNQHDCHDLHCAHPVSPSKKSVSL